MFMGARYYYSRIFPSRVAADEFASRVGGAVRIRRGMFEVYGSHWVGRPIDTCRDIKDYEVIAWEKYIESRDAKARVRTR